MSLQILNSPDITLLSVAVTFDISGTTPVIRLENLSQGSNLAGVDYSFSAQSPTTTFITEGDINNPDVSGLWSTFLISANWPRPFGQIEFSGAPYTFQVLAKDSNGTIFTAPVQTANICRPNGNLPTSTNTFGVGSVLVQTKCDQARIYFQDTTNTSYKGLDGVVGSSILRVNFPMDNTGTVPAPFEINYFSSAMVPITYSGKGYQFLYTSIWDYDFGGDVTVRIKYVKNDVFGVWCNISLMPLICEVQKLIASIETGSCASAEIANQKLMLINSKFSLVVIGMFQPLTGIDVPAVIEEIKEIGGFDCDCCNVGTGVIPVGSSAFDGYTFTVVPLGGDVEGEFVANGYNIQLQLSDVSYIFKICDSSPAETTAFTVTPSVSGDGYTKTYCLNVDMVQLAEDILNTIGGNAGLINLFNSLVINSGGTWTLIVDGNCIFSSGVLYDYTFHLVDIPENTTFALLSGLDINGVVVPLNFLFNMTSLPALQAYLNGLGYGTFVVLGTAVTDVQITSTNNATNINSLYITNTTGASIPDMDKTSTGFTPLSANQVVQNIINYLCALDDSQVVTSQEYEICYIDEAGEKQIQTVDSATSLATFLLALTTRGCTTIDYIVSLSSVNCTNIKALFPQKAEEVMQANDVILGTKNGECAGVYPTEAFLAMLTYGTYSSDVVTAFCNMVNLCSGGLTCSPYNSFFAEMDAGSPGSPGGEGDLVITFENPSELVVTNTIRYARIDNTVSPVYTTVTGLTPGDSPYTISGLDNGQYRVGITPVYADGRVCPEIFYDTAPCTGLLAFSAIYADPNIVVSATFVDTIVNARVNIYYPNGGTFSNIYTVTAGTMEVNIAPPESIFGTFFATISPVCDETSGWIGAPSAPATFEIEESSP